MFAQRFKNVGGWWKSMRARATIRHERVGNNLFIFYANYSLPPALIIVIIKRASPSHETRKEAKAHIK